MKESDCFQEEGVFVEVVRDGMEDHAVRRVPLLSDVHYSNTSVVSCEW